LTPQFPPHKISPESFDGVYPPLELFSLKEEVTLLPGGLFVCGLQTKSSQPRFQVPFLCFFLTAGTVDLQNLVV
jgi:hypothetical protein